MGTPRIPQVQLNAFPIITADSAAASGDIQIVGNTMTKYWSPAVTGINLATGVAGGVTGSLLDVRGVSRFAFVLTAVNTTAGSVTLTLAALYQNSLGAFQLISANLANLIQIAQFVVPVSAGTVLATGSSPDLVKIGSSNAVLAGSIKLGLIGNLNGGDAVTLEAWGIQ